MSNRIVGPQFQAPATNLVNSPSTPSGAQNWGTSFVPSDEFLRKIINKNNPNPQDAHQSSLSSHLSARTALDIKSSCDTGGINCRETPEPSQIMDSGARLSHTSAQSLSSHNEGQRRFNDLGPAAVIEDSVTGDGIQNSRPDLRFPHPLYPSSNPLGHDWRRIPMGGSLMREDNVVNSPIHTISTPSPAVDVHAWRHNVIAHDGVDVLNDHASVLSRSPTVVNYEGSEAGDPMQAGVPRGMPGQMGDSQKLPPLSPGNYIFENVSSALIMDLAGTDDAPIVGKPVEHGGRSQVWTLEQEDENFKIKSAMTGRYVAVRKNKIKHGVNLITSSKGFLWKFIPNNADGSYHILPANLSGHRSEYYLAIRRKRWCRELLREVIGNDECIQLLSSWRGPRNAWVLTPKDIADSGFA